MPEQWVSDQELLEMAAELPERGAHTISFTAEVGRAVIAELIERRKASACSATTPAGVWIVADTFWGYEGPGDVVLYADELDALRAVNTAGWQRRAWYVPFGSNLQDIMNATSKPQSPNTIEENADV